jgi:hypothetical protein
MSKKIYRSSMGKPVDIGALMLQNESIRAVGNMSVNARGDTINSTNKVIDQKPRQIQRQARKTTNVSNIPPATSNASLRQQASPELEADTFSDLPEDNDIVNEEVVEQVAVNETTEAAPQEEFRGGLAAAIAKAKTVNQTRMKTPREIAREQGVKKI